MRSGPRASRRPRKHAGHLGTEEGLESRQDGTDGSAMVTLSTWLDNTRKRTTKLPEQHRAGLDALGMR